MDYKYSTKFNCLASFIPRDSNEGLKISLASNGIKELEGLRSLGPSDEEIASNPDLLYISFNGAVTSLSNLNHDLIDNKTAIAICKGFINRYIDVEHSRDQCVGVITNAGFSKFRDNTIVDESEVSESNEPYNMSFCGIIWKTVDSYISRMIQESNNSESWMYKKISASWEIGFNEFAIARGSRNLANCEVIEDEEEVAKLSKHLLCMGGSGFDEDNKEVYRLIKGGVIALGLGLVSSPAASVLGVQVLNKEDDEDEDEDEEDDDEEEEDGKKNESYCSTKTKEKIQSDKSPLDEKKSIKANIISHAKKKIVRSRNIMKFTDINDICDNLEVAEASAVTQRELREFYQKTIDEAGAGYKKLESEKLAKEAELTDALAKAKDSEQKLKDLEVQLQEIKANAEKAAKQATFTERMHSITEKYNLDDKAQRVIAKQIKDLSDSDYELWLEEDAVVILAGKEKGSKLENSTEDKATEGLKEAQANVQHIPNTSHVEDEKKVATPWKLGEHFTIVN